MSSSAPRDLLLERAAAGELSLTATQVDLLLEYWRLLVHWNRTINLTALPIEPASAAAVDKMLIEPLAALAEVPDQPHDWVDLGSGGGSPAIPLKIVRPAARLTLVESRGRKAAFLREVARTLQLDDVAVVDRRIEAWLREPTCGRFSLVTVRALAVDAGMALALSAHLTSDARMLYFGGAEPPSIDGFDVVGTRRLVPTLATLYIMRRPGS